MLKSVAQRHHSNAVLPGWPDAFGSPLAEVSQDVRCPRGEQVRAAMPRAGSLLAQCAVGRRVIGSGMQVYIYRSRRRSETYLYLAERDAFDAVPAALRAALEPLEFSFTFALDAERALARADASVVRRNLAALGYHLQSPQTLNPVEAANDV